MIPLVAPSALLPRGTSWCYTAHPAEQPKHDRPAPTGALVVIWRAASDCTDEALYPDRNGRAARLLAAATPSRVSPGVYRVPSATGGTDSYLVRRVSRGAWRCACQDCLRGHICKHVRAVAMWLLDQVDGIQFRAPYTSEAYRRYVELALLVQPDPGTRPRRPAAPLPAAAALAVPAPVL